MTKNAGEDWTSSEQGVVMCVPYDPEDAEARAIQARTLLTFKSGKVLLIPPIIPNLMLIRACC